MLRLQPPEGGNRRDYTKEKPWQFAEELVLLGYKATKEFPKSEMGLIPYIEKSGA
jgi:hypothetical protein